MERLKRAVKNNFVFIVDGFILLSVMTVASWIAYKYKIFSGTNDTNSESYMIELDELLLLIALFCFGLLVISFRVLLSQRREVARRIKAEREMSDSAERLNKANQFLEMGERIARFGHFRVDGATR